MKIAVIDLGSNSLKLLVGEGVDVAPLHEAFANVRLFGDGDGSAIPPENFSAGIVAVQKLFLEAQAFSPEKIAIVGTSVFRTARNAPEFCSAILAKTGVPVRVLSGEEEAVATARGVATDPLVRALGVPVAVFDFGGGSLEFIGAGALFEKNWQLGAVRLMKAFVKNPAEPISDDVLKKIRAHVREVAGTELDAHTAPETLAVVCGGTLAIAHLILANKDGVPPAQFSRRLPLVRLELMLERLATRSHAERLKIAGVPAARADILPVALATLLEVADICGFQDLIYSPRNLRYGIVAQLSA